jgi:hypothetical protein
MRYPLTFALREASDAGHPMRLDSDSLMKVAAAAPQPGGLSEAIDRLLLLVGTRANYRKGASMIKDQDYPLLRARGADDMNALINFAMKLGYLEPSTGPLRPTIDGWKRIDQLRIDRPKSRRAFVAMWFSSDLDEAWKSGFRPGIEKTRYYSAYRVDSAQHNGKIDDRIIADIRESGLVVADFTGQRGGVYFEAGFALGIGIPVIWTCRADHEKELHFDTRQYNHILWASPGELAARLDERIRATVLPSGWNALV